MVISLILKESRDTTKTNNFDSFGEAMTDGRLTEHSSPHIYKLREAILLSKQLGRPLTPEEMKQFEVA